MRHSRRTPVSLLVELLGKKNSARFFHGSWPGEPMVCHGPISRLRVARLPELLGPGSLAQAWSGRIQAWAKPDSGMPAIEAMPDQAVALYDAGYTLFFPNVQRQVPSVAALAQEFATATGVSRDRVSCEAFFSRGGSGAPPHFDPYGGFNVQLVGEKKWHLRKNDHVEYPMTGGAMVGVPDPAHHGCAKLPFPDRMPDDATRVATRPGSVVFVPAGYWHSTRAVEGESVAIVFSMNRDPWSGKIVRELEGRLNKGLAIARSSPLLNIPSLYERQRAELETVLAHLKQVVRDLEAEALLRQWIARDRPSYAIRRGVALHFVRGAPQWTVHVTQGGRKLATKMHASYVEVLRVLARAKQPIARDELPGLLPEPRALDQILQELVDIGLVAVYGPAWLAA